MIYGRILCPVDFSDPARAALDAAAELARLNQARLLLLHVYELPAEMYARGMYGTAELLAELRAAVEQQLDEWRAHAAAAGAPAVETRAVRGAAAHEIVVVAGAEEADLVVMGTHGRTGLRRLLLGSVAQRVVRHAPCSVLVVR